jgi:hypothetical protein
MRASFIAILLLFAPVMATAQPKDGPTPIPAPVKKVVVPDKIAAKPDSLLMITADATDKVEWLVWDKHFVEGKNSKTGDKVLTLSIPSKKEPWSFKVTVIDYGAKMHVDTLVQVDGADPTPVPDPPTPVDLNTLSKKIDDLTVVVTAIKADVDALKNPPMPPVTTLIKHVTFIGAERTAVAVAVNNDAGLRAMFKNAGIAVHVCKADDPSLVAKHLTAAVAKAGGVPCVVMQDADGNVVDQGPMTSVQQVTDLASKHIRR